MSEVVARRIGDVLADAVHQHPDREAVVFAEQRIAYRELDRDVRRCVRALHLAGIRRGDRIAMLTTPRPEFLVIFLATLRLGAIWVGLNPVHQPAELCYVLDDCRPRLLFGFAQLRGRDNRAFLHRLPAETPCIERIIIFDEAEGLGEPYTDFSAAGDAITDASLAAAFDSVGLDDVAMIVHTSGSTGQPKGAMITQRNLMHCALVQRALF